MAIQRFVSVLCLCAFCSTLNAETTVNFEGLLANPDSFYNGDTGESNSDGWVAGEIGFSNTFTQTPDYFYWTGWSYSNVSDSGTPGFGNQYAAFPGGGSDGAGGAIDGQGYALAYYDGFTPTVFTIPEGARLSSMDWTNGTYPGLSMQNGDSFAKKFGGPDMTDPDFFRAILTGYAGANGNGEETGTIQLDLADFTSDQSNQDTIVDSWQINQDLTALGDARSVALSFESSDVGDFGINTPQYLFIDNLSYSVTAIPEPSAAMLLAFFGAGAALRRRRRRV